MSAGREVNADSLSAREQAVRWVENHPLRDGIAQSVLFVMCRLINGDDRMVWPSVEFLVWRTGFSANAVKRVIGNFRRHGILRETGERHGQGGTIIYFVHYELSVEAYPDCLTFEDHKARERSRRDDRRTSNVRPQKANVPAVNGGPQKANVKSIADDNVRPLNGQRSPSDNPTFAFSNDNVRLLDTQRSPSEGYEGLEGLQQGLKAGNEGALIAAQASPLSRTDDDRRPRRTEALAKALADAFFDAHGELIAKNDIALDCERFAAAGANVDDMLAAISTVKRNAKQPASKPRWSAVHNTLDGMLRTRETVVNGLLHKCSAEAVCAAQRLESIYARYFDKPAWSASRSRYDMGEWLCRCISWGNVDEAMFEAACRDVKKRANGKPPTWKHVRAALEARIEAHKRGAQQAPADKPFFESPARMAGTYVVPGNDTRH